MLEGICEELRSLNIEELSKVSGLQCKMQSECFMRVINELVASRCVLLYSTLRSPRLTSCTLTKATCVGAHQ